MGKKGLVSIFSRLVDSAGAPSSSPAAGAATPPWPWPPCGTNPKTASFRAGGGGEPCCSRTSSSLSAGGACRRGGPAAATGNNSKLMPRGRAAPGEMYKTVNSVYFDDSAADADFFSLAGDEDELLDLDDVESFVSTTTASEEWSEAVIRSLGRTSTDRFFFDPGPLPASNSILAAAASPEAAPAAPEEKTKTKAVMTPPEPDTDDDAVNADGAKNKTRRPCRSSSSLAEGSVAVAVDSGDPYGDFRASMEEMVSAHGLRDWAALEELLAWYLRINGKHHHHLIVGAFVDLLLGLASSNSSTVAETSTTTTTTTTTTTSSSSTSGSACAGSRCTTTSTSTSTAATTTSASPAAAAASEQLEQCGGGNEAAACCSSSSSSCAAGPDVVNDDVAVEQEEARAGATDR